MDDLIGITGIVGLLLLVLVGVSFGLPQRRLSIFGCKTPSNPPA